MSTIPLRFRDLRIAASVYGIAAVACMQLPLLNYLGYEFSVAIALLGSFISGLRTIRLVKHASASTETQEGQHIIAAFKLALVSNTLLLIIPLLIAAFNALFVKNCSFVEGASFFLLIPVVSVWFACSVGFFCAVHYRLARTIFVLLVIATVLYSAALGYFTPAIFSYNFFYGFFPGLTYDETLSLTWTLVLFRVITVCAGAALVWMATLVVIYSRSDDPAWMKGLQLIKALAYPGHRLITAVIVVLAVTVYVSRNALGFESSRAYIQRQLGEKLHTEHFTIYYAPGSYTDEELRWVATEHEFRLHQVLEAFSIRFHGTIESYIYPTNEIKRRLIGTGATNIAKPWSGQIHITKQSLHRTLKHELVHVVAAPFGVPVIRASLSTGLVEGLAMAIDWDWGTRTLHQYAAGMKRLGILPDIKELMLLTGFAAHSSSVSYVVAGSFCRFLIDRYGMRAMTNLYHTLDYRATYGRSLDMLMNEWLSFLDRVPSDDHDRDAVNALFRRPPIFRKVCARVTAERNVRAARMLSAMNFASAAALYKQSYDESHNYEALSGYLSSALREKNFDALTGILDSTIEKDPLPEQYLPLYVTIGIACWAKGDSARARDLFHQVELVDIQQNLTEAAAACRIALNDSLNRSSLLEYFLSSSGDTLRLGMLGAMVQNPVQHWLPLYLKGILLHRLGRFPEVLATLHALDPGVPEKHLEAIRLKTMGDALVRMRRFQEAKACFWVSLNAVSTDAAQHEINDLIDRCEWISEHGLE